MKPLHTADGTELEWQGDFKYLGSWMESSEKDIRIRKARAWKALKGMSKIWKSSINRGLKVCFFIATIESILLYGCESRTLSEAQEKSLNCTYTRMLCEALNVHWNSHLPIMQLHGDLPAVSDKTAPYWSLLPPSRTDSCYGNPSMARGGVADRGAQERGILQTWLH